MRHCGRASTLVWLHWLHQRSRCDVSPRRKRDWLPCSTCAGVVKRVKRGPNGGGVVLVARGRSARRCVCSSRLRRRRPKPERARSTASASSHAAADSSPNACEIATTLNPVRARDSPATASSNRSQASGGASDSRQAPGGARAVVATPDPGATRTPHRPHSRMPPAPARPHRRAPGAAARTRHPAAAGHVRGSPTPTDPPPALAAPSPARRSLRHHQVAPERRVLGHLDAGVAIAAGAAADRNASRSERRIIHFRGPAFEARSWPVVIHRRTVTTVTCSSSATWAGVRYRSSAMSK